MTVPYDALIGLGSNIGDKAANIEESIRLLTWDGAVRLVSRSRLYQTPPWGVTEQDWFVNACIAIATDCSARDLLVRCQAVETDMGRVRVAHWGARIIDVDILTYRGESIADPDLIVPHPYIQVRAFVLVPLAEIAPDEQISGRSVVEWCASIDTAGVTRYLPD